MTRPITREERHAGAFLAEFPGDPNKFPFEALSPVTQQMIRRKLADMHDEADPEVVAENILKLAIKHGGILTVDENGGWGVVHDPLRYSGKIISDLLADGALRPLRCFAPEFDRPSAVTLVPTHPRVRELLLKDRK